MPTTKQSFLLALMCIVFAGTSLVWLHLDRVPPNWDDAWYLTNSLVLYDSLTQGGVLGYVAGFFSVLEFKAPLITALPTPLYLIFGRLWQAAYLVNIAAMVALILTVFAIGRKSWSARAGLIASYLIGTMPLLYGLTRWYVVEYALTAAVALSVYLLIRSEHLERTWAAVLFGVICGFGLLLKISFAVFILPAFLYVWLKSSRRSRCVLAAAPCAILALPWYAFHARATIDNAIAAGYGYSAIVQGTGPIFSPLSIGTYILRVANEGISAYYALVAALLLAAAVVRPQGRDLLRNLVRNPNGLLLLWILPFLIFLFAGNKDVRYVAPILPAFALLAGALLDSVLGQGRWAIAILCLILAFPLFSTLSVSFGFPTSAGGIGYARHYDSNAWPLEEMLNVAARQGNLRSGEKWRLLLGTDRAALNANNLELAAVSERLPFIIETAAYEKDLDVLLHTLSQADFFVYKKGGEPESTFFNRHQRELVSEVINGGRFEEIPFGRALPDGGVAHIFKNRKQGRLQNGAHLPSGLEQPMEFEVDFAGILQLTGMSFTNNADGLELKLRWRALARPDREYWCFTHILDAQGNTVLNLDHKILDGEPPLIAWKPGDSALEQLRARLPPGIAGSSLRVRLGLYYPASGDRLQIRPLKGPAEAKFSVLDRSTALMAGN